MNNNKEIIKHNNNTLRKAKNLPSSSTIWSNSVYSFNKNYLKNIPAADNIVNKLIKSFFTINALDNNAKGLKSKLIQRRYKRLSLNKILVSRSEIKHSNDKVFITVYLFNKRKRSLLLKLNELYNALSLKKTNTFLDNIGLKSKDRNMDMFSTKLNYLSNNNMSDHINKLEENTKYKNMSLSSKYSKYISWRRYINKINLLNINSSDKKYINTNYKLKTVRNNTHPSSITNKIKNLKLLNNVLVNKYVPVNLNLTSLYSDKDKKYNDLTFKLKDNIKCYQNISNLMKYNIVTYLNFYPEALDKENRRNILGNLLTKINPLMNKYKLYNNYLSKLLIENNALDNNYHAKSHKVELYSVSGLIKKPNYSIYKLKSMYKLFALYNNIFTTRKEDISSNIYNKKMLLNTYKLLKKSDLKFSNNIFNSYESEKVNYKELAPKSNVENSTNNKIMNTTVKARKLTGFNTVFISRKGLANVASQDSAKNVNFILKIKNTSTGLTTPASKLAPKSYAYLKRNMKNVILLNKLNRIDMFFNKYKNVLLNVENNKGMTLSCLNNIITERILNTYKINLINELLDKELLYVYYLKLLSYNDAVFKNWFLYSLKNIISKIYNKKIIFNLVNLKYIHLNSDILSQAVNIRLKNFRQNTVVQVLKNVVKLVPTTKINIYSWDEHSSVYKYVNKYNNKFKNLKLDIFKELGLITTNDKKMLTQIENSNLVNLGFPSQHSAMNKGNPETFSSMLKGPCKIKRLNHMQASTINFIKYKSVFGVRLEAAGRLTKRSTASRSLFKFKYHGTLKNNPTINNSISSVIIKNNITSNLQFTKITSKTRNGSFGLKGWVNSN